jgi:hypothetical protein
MRKEPFYEHRVITQLRWLVAHFLQLIMWLDPRAVPLGHLLGKAAVRQASSLVFLCPLSVILSVSHNIYLASMLYTACNENVTKWRKSQKNV